MKPRLKMIHSRRWVHLLQAIQWLQLAIQPSSKALYQVGLNLYRSETFITITSARESTFNSIDTAQPTTSDMQASTAKRTRTVGKYFSYIMVEQTLKIMQVLRMVVRCRLSWIMTKKT